MKPVREIKRSIIADFMKSFVELGLVRDVDNCRDEKQKLLHGENVYIFDPDLGITFNLELLDDTFGIKVAVTFEAPYMEPYIHDATLVNPGTWQKLWQHGGGCEPLSEWLQSILYGFHRHVRREYQNMVAGIDKLKPIVDNLDPDSVEYKEWQRRSENS